MDTKTLQGNLEQVTAISKTLKAAGLCGELTNLYRFPDHDPGDWFVIPCLLPAGHPADAYGQDRHTGIFDIPLPGCCTTDPGNTCWCPRDCECTCNIGRCSPCYIRRREASS